MESIHRCNTQSATIVFSPQPFVNTGASSRGCRSYRSLAPKDVESHARCLKVFFDKMINMWR
jgi:hypothetical protein